MAVKAREEVRSQGFSLPAMILIFLFVLGYTIFYNQMIRLVSDYGSRTAIGIVALGLMILFFVIVLKFHTTKYFMVLTHKNLNITRKVFFSQKEVCSIPISSMTRILSEAAASRAEGSNKNYTLARMDNKAKYVVYYTKDNKTHSVKIQCSSRFYKELKALIK